MRYPGCAAGGMRRVRRNAASKLNNGRCTSQTSAMSSRRGSGESCTIAASRRAALRSRRPQGRHHPGGARAYRPGAPRLRAPLARCLDIGPSPARRDCVAAIYRQSRARLLAEAPEACCYRNALPSLRKRASGRERPPAYTICFQSAPRPAVVDGRLTPKQRSLNLGAAAVAGCPRADPHLTRSRISEEVAAFHLLLPIGPG